MSDPSPFIDFAHRLADAAGAAILPYFRANVAVEGKTMRDPDGRLVFDPVTIADQEGERAIRALIRADYPDHGILGEEHGEEKGSAPYTWVIDPIDGTRAFIAGNPQWGTLIALNDGVRPVLGVLDQPYMGERWIGSAGRRTTFHARGAVQPAQCRVCPDLEQAIIATTHPWAYFSTAEQAAFRRVDARAKLTRFGGDCYSYGLVALGCIDAVIEARLKAWDIQALIPIIEGAGGKVTAWDGGDAQAGDTVVASGDATLHQQILDVLNA